MATIHLINDNGAVIHADEGGTNHLAGITKDSSHLVVVRQTSNWTNKEFIITPSVKEFAWVDAYGIENYKNVQGGANVRNDTQAIVDLAETTLENSTWTTGNKAIFALYTRSYDPFCLYALTQSEALNYSGVCKSAVALKFNFRHLHFSKLESFKAYLRCYIPSALTCYPTNQNIAYVIGSSGYLTENNLQYKFVRELPETVGSVINTGYSSLSLAGRFNNGQISTASNRDVPANGCLTYDPYDQYSYDSSKCGWEPFRTYATSDSNPTSFYCDLEIVGEQLEFLKKNPGAVWLLARFNNNNLFSNGTAGNGLAPSVAFTLFIQRIEIVLKCTGTKFNN